jgi:hypothetical protein
MRARLKGRLTVLSDTVLVPFDQVKEVMKVNSRTGRRVGLLVGAAIDATAMILAVENQPQGHYTSFYPQWLH